MREPTNWFWRRSKARYLAKVGDDCLMPAGWWSTLVEAHRCVPGLGMIACWHFWEADYIPEVAEVA